MLEDFAKRIKDDTHCEAEEKIFKSVLNASSVLDGVAKGLKDRVRSNYCMSPSSKIKVRGIRPSSLLGISIRTFGRSTSK